MQEWCSSDREGGASRARPSGASAAGDCPSERSGRLIRSWWRASRGQSEPVAHHPGPPSRAPLWKYLMYARLLIASRQLFRQSPPLLPRRLHKRCRPPTCFDQANPDCITPASDHQVILLAIGPPIYDRNQGNRFMSVFLLTRRYLDATIVKWRWTARRKSRCAKWRSKQRAGHGSVPPSAATLPSAIETSGNDSSAISTDMPA